MSELHVVKARGKRKVLKPVTREQIEKTLVERGAGEMLDSQHTLILMLLPPAVKAFFTELEGEVTALFDQQVFQDGIRHVSQRDYEAGLPKIAASFGVSKSAVSRSWVKSTKKQVEKLLSRDRDLAPLAIIAVFIDGKRFQKLGAVVALGIAADGKKHV